MASIQNVEVNGLETSIFRSGYPMMAAPPTPMEFREAVDQIHQDLLDGNENKHIKRAINLATAKGGGHDQFLTGITVNFDMTFSNKAWVEAERYTFLNFISSCSTMHRIAKMGIEACCNEFVIPAEIRKATELQQHYNENPTQENYLKLLYNLPSGFEITAGMTTNYRCLKNIYAQRRNHRLPDWWAFCDWVETLPLSVLITGAEKDE